MASTGTTMAFSLGRNIGVGWGIFVSLWAVCLGRHVTATVAAPDILGVGHGLKVGRVDAVGGPTTMVKLQACWDRAYKHFIGDAVCSRNPPIFTEATIARSTLRARPQPAVCDGAYDMLGVEAGQHGGHVATIQVQVYEGQG